MSTYGFEVWCVQWTWISILNNPWKKCINASSRFGDIWISFVCSGRVSSHFLFWSPTFVVQTKFFKIIGTFLHHVIYSRWVDFLDGKFVGLSEFSNGEAIDDILTELLRQNRRDLKIRYVALVSHWISPIQCWILFYLFSSCGAATRPLILMHMEG